MGRQGLTYPYYNIAELHWTSLVPSCLPACIDWLDPFTTIAFSSTRPLPLTAHTTQQAQVQAVRAHEPSSNKRHVSEGAEESWRPPQASGATSAGAYNTYMHRSHNPSRTHSFAFPLCTQPPGRRRRPGVVVVECVVGHSSSSSGSGG